MPTEEFPEVLAREHAKGVAQELRDTAGPLFTEVVNHACWAWRRCVDAAPAQMNVALASMWLYRHVIENVDGIGVLVSESCGTAAAPLLRTAFEASVQLEFLLSDRATFERRSLAWVCMHQRDKLKQMARWDPETPEGQEFHSALKLQAGELPEPPNTLRAERDKLTSFLQQGQFAEISSALGSGKKALTHWYQLDGGPANVREVARRLDRLAEYDVLYRHWSKSAHGTDLDLYLISLSDRDEKGSLRAVRDPSSLSLVATMGIHQLLRATRAMIDFYRKGESLNGWYQREVMVPLRKLHTLRPAFTYVPREGLA